MYIVQTHNKNSLKTVILWTVYMFVIRKGNGDTNA